MASAHVPVLLEPAVEQGGRATDTMIQSKVMVVDDRFLRVGSANMNNRSMGADTECDLAVEAHTDRERAAVLEIRNRLLGVAVRSTRLVDAG